MVSLALDGMHVLRKVAVIMTFVFKVGISFVVVVGGLITGLVGSTSEVAGGREMDISNVILSGKPYKSQE